MAEVKISPSSLARRPLAHFRNMNNACDEDMDVDCECTESSPKISTLPPQTKELYPDLSGLEDSISDESLLGELDQFSSKDTTPKSSNKKDVISSGGRSCIYIAIVVLIAILCYLLQSYIWSMHDSSSEMIKMPIIEEFLSSIFPSDYHLSKKVIKSALRKVIKQDVEPEHPAIIFLLASVEATQESNKFSSCLARLLDHSYLELKGSKLRKIGTEEMLHKKIETFLNNGHSLKVVLIKDLNIVPYQTAKGLHLFCDHENAPFKRAVFIITANSNEIIPIPDKSSSMDKYATELLEEAWQDWHEDQRSALLSRITVSVAAILPNLTLSKCKS